MQDLVNHKMKIAVLAANGRLGKALVAEALARGHQVRAGIRGGDYSLKHDNLHVVQCDATNIADVEVLIKECDAVVSCIGHVKGSPSNVQTVATKTAIEAMDHHGIKRFVDITGTGVRMSGDTIPLIDSILNAAVKLVDPHRIADGIEHTRILQNSDVDWTTIRVLKLQTNSKKPYKLLLHGPTKLYVSRQDTARAMLDVIENNSFIEQAPMIG